MSELLTTLVSLGLLVYVFLLDSKVKAVRRDLTTLQSRFTPGAAAETSASRDVPAESRPAALPEAAIAREPVTVAETAYLPSASETLPLSREQPTRSRSREARHRRAVDSRLSQFLKQNMFASIGVVLVLLGCSFLFPMLAARFYFPPMLRLAAAVGVGAGLMAGGLRLARRSPEYAQILQGGGAAVIYLAAYVAMTTYAILPVNAAFAVFAMLSALVITLSDRQSAKPLALFGFAGAYLSPVLTAHSTASLGELLSYGLLVNLAAIWMAARRRWLGLIVLAFAATLLVGAGTYAGIARALSEPMQQLMLAIYSVLFAAVPFVYLKGAYPTREERITLGIVVAFTTPVALALESWIGGSRGLQIAGALAAVAHLAVFRAEIVKAPAFRWVHAMLALLSAITAISALHLGDAASSLLLEAVAAIAYAYLPGRMRVLAAAPTASALLMSAMAHNPLVLTVTTVLLLVAGAYAVYKTYRLDPWLFHGASAVYASMVFPRVVPIGSDGHPYALVVSAMLALALYLAYRKSRDISAFTSHAVATAAWLGMTMIDVPHGAMVVALQFLGAGLCCVIAVIAERLSPDNAQRPQTRMLMVIVLPALTGVLLLQHIELEPTLSNALACLSWLLLVVLALLYVPAVKRWIGSIDLWTHVRCSLALIAMPMFILFQWSMYVALKEHASAIGLQSAWMVIASTVLVRLVPHHLSRAVFAVVTSLIAAWFLQLAGLSSAITLAWAIAGLGAMLMGSRMSDRILWLAGAGMSGAVVAKLILLDMGNAEPVWRVLSFIGSGLLFLLAGYLAPAPSAAHEQHR